MKHIAILVALAVPILGAAVAHGATPNRHNLTLVFEGTGEEATLRLLPEHVSAHVSLDPLTPVPGVISERDDKQLSRRWSVWCDPTHRNAASSNGCRILAQSIQNSAIVVNNIQLGTYPTPLATSAGREISTVPSATSSMWEST